MTTFDLTYNPFTKEKIFKVDGKEADLEECWGQGNKELVEWSGSFFEVLYKKYNDSEITVNFKGIVRDLQFLEDAKLAYEMQKPNLKITINDVGCSLVKNRIEDLKKLFHKMQTETPFEKLKSDDLKNTFNKAVSSEFEMAVVATMSSGKSTLINSMLGRELLPARNEATTATLARIHDIDGLDDFKGKSYDSEGNVLEDCDPLTLDNMDKLNDDPKTSIIEIYGDIAGVDSKDLRLVISDTPGPNNSRTNEHKAHTYALLKSEYKPMIVYVLNAQSPASTDDETLLADVAEAMNEGGRQAKERFIFVLNKADAIDPGKGESVPKMIEHIKEYLEKHGIKNARIFPTNARMAKVIRQYKNKQPLTEYEEDEVLSKYDSLIKREWKHLSNFSPLSETAKREQDEMLKSAQERNDTYDEALIYTGVPAIELTINEYLSKYALPAKITEGVFSFKETINKLGIEAEATERLKNDKSEFDKLAKNLEKIKLALKKSENVNKIKSEIEKLSASNVLREKFETAFGKIMDEYEEKTKSMQNKKMDEKVARSNAELIKKFLNDVQLKFRTDIEVILQDVLVSQAQVAVDEYKKYVEDLVGEVSYDMPTEAILGDLSSIDVTSTLNDYSHNESVFVGTRIEKNNKKSWFIPWTWFLATSITKNIYDEIKYIDFSEFLENEIEPNLRKALSSMQEAAFDWAKKEEERFRIFFKEQLNKLNERIEEKIEEKEELLHDKEKFEKRIKDNETKLSWLNGFKKELDKVIAI